MVVVLSNKPLIPEWWLQRLTAKVPERGEFHSMCVPGAVLPRLQKLIVPARVSN